jgi:hypothetical protein
MQLNGRHPERPGEQSAAAQTQDGPVGQVHGLEAGIGEGVA